MEITAPPTRFIWKKGLTDLEIRVGCHTDSTCYAELLEELKADEVWRGRRTYIQMQRRAGIVWAAVRAYREEQKAARTPSASPVAREVPAPAANRIQCGMCNNFYVPEFDGQDYCSYHCASGGGWSVHGSCQFCGERRQFAQNPLIPPTCCGAAKVAHVMNLATEP